jgi:riboflavin transporter FmnP
MDECARQLHPKAKEGWGVIMEKTKQSIRLALIATLVLVISILHYTRIHGNMELHILHRELFFIPILLTCFWFGLRAGVTIAVIVSLIYAPFIFFAHATPHNTVPAVIIQILVFNLIAFGFGWLVERQRKQHKEVMEAESLSTLGRAAIAVGHEMRICWERSRDWPRKLEIKDVLAWTKILSRKCLASSKWWESCLPLLQQNPYNFFPTI